jgi:hypothetical protein
MRCDFKPITEPDEQGQRSYECWREGCGRKTAPTPHGPDKIHATCRVIGWGDYVTYYLALLGLTKQRVQWLTRKPCGCEARQEAINTWGERLRAWWLR